MCIWKHQEEAGSEGVGPGPPTDRGYPTSIGYLRRSTVCSEPLVAGPPQWKCSWMVWYTSGRPPPLTDMPLPTCRMTGTQKHPFSPIIHRCSGARICVYRNVRRSGGPSVLSGCPRSPPGAESPETGSCSSARPGRWASDAPPVTGDRRGPGPPTRTGLRTWTEQEFRMTQTGSETPNGRRPVGRRNLLTTVRLVVAVVTWKRGRPLPEPSASLPARA